MDVFFLPLLDRGKSDFTCLREWWDHGKTETMSVAHPQQDTCRSIKKTETDIVELQMSESTRI